MSFHAGRKQFVHKRGLPGIHTIVKEQLNTTWTRLNEVADLVAVETGKYAFHTYCYLHNHYLNLFLNMSRIGILFSFSFFVLALWMSEQMFHCTSTLYF